MKRNVVFKLSKGFHGRSKNNYTMAANKVDKSLSYAFRDRKNRKRVNRSLWIQQINAATRQFNVAYSQFIGGVAQSDIALNRKMLAGLAVSEPFSFHAIVNHVKDNQTTGIQWRNVNHDVMPAQEYNRYIDEKEKLPESWKSAPQGPGEQEFAPIVKQFAKAQAAADKKNEYLIEKGKVKIQARYRKDTRTYED
eukprot:TRINITY_DN10492_c0_g1_i1.p1 TRINITY_DN10492_c0_g1~~TRINITY_DN10492_c0_g1_i1.p1  ORF type:complete len:210 (-),score=66.28 TRINITY_DN10492_c0_g1_i1:75-656(-)